MQARKQQTAMKHLELMPIHTTAYTTCLVEKNYFRGHLELKVSTVFKFARKTPLAVWGKVLLNLM